MKNISKSAYSVKILMFLSVSFMVLSLYLVEVYRSLTRESFSLAVSKSNSARVGEKITYDIRLGLVSLGEARFACLAGGKLADKDVNIMTFETRLARFSDLEKIYTDPDSFLPLRVERDISTWPFPEKITEEYDQEKYILTITKFKAGKKEKLIMKKDASIHNAILLPYHVRNLPALSIGWNFTAKLPSREFQIKLVSIEDVKVPAGTFKAYHFESEPKKFEIWISADERRIPVKIKGSGMLGYVFLMKEYSLADQGEEGRVK